MTAPLDIQDYLDATNESAKRVRTTCISLVVASVLMFAALLNSLQHSWMLQRLDEWKHPTSPYVISKIGPPVAAGPTPEFRAYEARYEAFYGSLSRTYVENAYVLRVPFFGVAVDVNDVGLIGGIAFVIMLTMLRFSLSREVDNLRISFAEADRLGMIREFYVLLAMRQVFTVPFGSHIRRGRFMQWVPKLFLLAPAIVYTAFVAHDVTTSDIGSILNEIHTLISLPLEVLISLLILALTYMVVRRLRLIDAIWDKQWEDLPARDNPAPGHSQESLEPAHV